MRKGTKRGFLTVEAAVFLPICIIAVLSICYLIKVTAADEEVIHAMSGETHEIAAEAYAVKYQPLFRAGLRKRILEYDSDISSCEVTHFRYLYSDRARGIDDLIAVRVDYTLGMKLPLSIGNDVYRSGEVLARGFTGTEFPDAEDDFDRFERDEESEEVWVFPRRGSRYHKKDCSYIEVYAYENTLSASLQRRYKPCSICKPKAAKGESVYCFRTGDVYHSALCSTVDRYVVSMEKKDAIEKGYTACSRCGG